jgi:acetyl esterase/lipase
MSIDELDRRDFILAGLGLAVAGHVAAQPLPPDWPPPENFPLWPVQPPGMPAIPPVPNFAFADRPGRPVLRVTGVATPELHVFRPERSNGAAVLVTPGGSYGLLSVQNEGIDAAAFLNSLGYSVFVLTYRLPAEGWSQRADVALQDAQRAMRLIRSKAEIFNFDRNRIAVLGFSAGGHLAASLATGFDEALYHPVDSADQLSARPDCGALVYPVIVMEPPFVHVHSRDNLLGPEPSAELLARRSPHLRVSASTPPCLLVHAIDDHAVPVENSLEMLAALRGQKIATAAHLFEQGGHGFGFQLPPEQSGARWPSLLQDWLARHMG